MGVPSGNRHEKIQYDGQGVVMRETDTFRR